MNLHQRLSKIRQDFEAGATPKKTVDILNMNIDRLLEANVAGNALAVGDRSPMGVLVQSRAGEVPLSDFFRGEYLVLNWFRGNW